MPATEFFSRVETRRCPHCGYLGEVEVPNSGLARWTSGTLIQDAFPDLSVPLREQIMTGIHPECWAALFG